jgi:hypothetical protein
VRVTPAAWQTLQPQGRPNHTFQIAPWATIGATPDDRWGRVAGRARATSLGQPLPAVSECGERCCRSADKSPKPRTAARAIIAWARLSLAFSTQAGSIVAAILPHASSKVRFESFNGTWLERRCVQQLPCFHVFPSRADVLLEADGHETTDKGTAAAARGAYCCSKIPTLLLISRMLVATRH